MTEPQTAAGESFRHDLTLGGWPWDDATRRIVAVEDEARATAGHRTEREHDCFLMNCKAIGPELESARLYGTTADAELAAEKERVARLREGFTAYGQHQQPCAFGPTVRCTCGYIDTLRSLTLGAG